MKSCTFRSAIVLACMLVAFIALPASAHADASWTGNEQVSQRQTISGMSCPAATFCMVVGNRSSSTFNGSEWSQPQLLPVDDAYPSWVACVSEASCLVLGAIDTGETYTRAAWFYDGATWASRPAPPTGNGFDITQLACGSASMCLALNDSGEVSTFNGATWTDPVRLPGMDEWASTWSARMQCASATDCLVAQPGGEIYTFNGTVWTQVVAAADVTSPDEINALACASSSYCLAIGSLYDEVTEESTTTYSTFDGGSWTHHGAAGVAGLDPYTPTLECPAPGACISLASGDGTTTTFLWNGAAWSAAAGIPGAEYLDSGSKVRCTSPTACVYAGANPQRAATWNGTAWALRGFGGGDIIHSCASTSFCVVADAGGYARTWNGATWSARSNIAGAAAARALSCASPTSCVMVDSSNQTFEFDGGTWTQAVDSPLGMQPDISCASASFCVGVSEWESTASVFDGATWSAPVVHDPNFMGSDGGPMFAAGIACASTTFCVAVGYAGYATVFDGAAWSAPQQISTGTNAWLSAISCASPAFCVATQGAAGGAFVFDGATWSARAEASPYGLSAISCGTAGTCVAAGYDTYVTFDGTGWSAPAYISGGTFPDGPFSVRGLDCQSASFCMASDGDWMVARFVGTIAYDPARPTNQTPPVITGTAQVASVLSASTGTWAGSPTAYTYYWLSCNADGVACSSVGNASSSYIVSSDDAGRRLRVAVSASNAAGASALTYSQLTDTVPIPPVPANTQLPTLAADGPYVPGTMLTLSDGTWSGDPYDLYVTWLRCDAAGDNCDPNFDVWNSQYELTNDDIGFTIRADVVAVNDTGSSNPARTAATSLITAPGAVGDRLTSATIIGSAVVGSTLSIVPGTWSTSETVTYEWARYKLVEVPGFGLTWEEQSPVLGTGLAYVVTAADLGMRIGVAERIASNPTTFYTALTETVVAAATTPPPAPPAPPTTTTTQNPAPQPPAPVVTPPIAPRATQVLVLPRQPLATVATTGVLRVRFPVAAAGVTVTTKFAVSATVARQLRLRVPRGGRSVVIGTSSLVTRRSGQTVAVIRLNRAARTALVRTRMRLVAGSVTIQLTKDGATSQVSRAFTIRR